MGHIGLSHLPVVSGVCGHAGAGGHGGGEFYFNWMMAFNAQASFDEPASTWIQILEYTRGRVDRWC